MPIKSLGTEKIYASVDGELIEIGRLTDFEADESLVEVADLTFNPQPMSIEVDMHINRRTILYLLGAVTDGEIKFSKKWRRLKSIRRRLKREALR